MTLNPISGPDAGSVFDVPSGKDLYVPLTGVDPGETISYTVTSSDPNVTATVFGDNPTLLLTVEGTDNDGQAFSGTMTVQLFDNLAPETVGVIENLVDSGFYDGLSFYRIVPNFVIQGGANGSKTVSMFDDEFNVALTFNSPGLLAMANPGTPDSNTSEFFITDIDLPLVDDPYYLNFRHTIFGQLTSGFDLYQDIMNAEGVSDSNSSPTSPVTIVSATIINDSQNSVVQIAPSDDFVGTATFTVTANSTDGSSAQQTFTINALAPATATESQPLVLDPVDDMVTDQGTPINFDITASQFFGSNPTFSVTGASSFTATPSNVSVSITPTGTGSATVTLTPASGFSGTITLLAHVDDDSYDLHDAQEFTLTVAPAVEITSVTDPINADNANSVTVSGTGRVGASISLIGNDGNDDTDTYMATVGSDGTWTISGIDVTALGDGTILFNAKTSNPAGGTVESNLQVTKDTEAPSVVISDVTDPINADNADGVTISGTSEAGATISVVVSDGTDSTMAYTTTVDESGNWSISDIDTTALGEGTLTFEVTATDSAGNVNEASRDVEKDTVAPEIALTSVADPIAIDDIDSVSASGTGEVGATISVIVADGVNSTIAVITTVGADGTWSVGGIDVSPLADGEVTYVATATDAAGNSSQSSQTATKDTVAISVVTDPVNADNAEGTSASGTGEVGATISLVVTDGTTTTDEYTTTVGGDGTWSIDDIDVTTLADGDITYMVTATNAQENSAHTSATVSKDTVPPTATILSTSDPINLDNETATFINGSTEAGATVSVVASDGTNTTDAVNTTAGGFGTWSFSDIDVSGLDDGTITYTVTVTDAAGNSAEFSQTATKDTVAPDVTISTVTDPVDLSNYTDVTVSGTGEVGASISVVVSDGVNATTAATTTVGADGTWSISGIDVGDLTDGTITFTATASDASFNTAETSTTAEKATVGITLVTDPITQNNVTSVSATGTGQVGATVSLVVSDGTNSTSTFTTTVGADGTWSISNIDVSALGDGTLTFTASSDDGENSSAESSLTATKDTVAPAVAITSVTDPINDSNATTVSASGTGEAGALVTLVASDGTNSSTSYSVVVASDGTWQIDNIDVSALDDGAITFTASTTDNLGNSMQSAITATKGPLALNSLSGLVFVDSNGNGVHDETETVLGGVLVTLNGVDAQGNPIATQMTTTASDGTYSFDNLSPGTYSLTEAQPAEIADGSAIVGSLGGSAGTNTIFGIVMTSGGVGSDYNFSESGLDISMVSARLFLASTPPAEQILSNAVAQNGTAAPIISAITKADADPTTAASVNYSVTFSESVTGVDVGDFAVYGNSGASVESVSGSGSSYTVTVATPTITGSVGLRLVDDDSIVNQNGAPLGGEGAGNGDFTASSYTTTGQDVAVAVTFTTDPINADNESDVSVNGTGDAGATITLVASDGTNTTTQYTTTVGSDGTWSINGIDVSDLDDGTVTFTATATASGSNTAQSTGTATKDTVAPQVLAESVTDPINSDEASDVVVSGTGEAGASISLVASDGTNSSTTYMTTVASDGSWSITGIDVSALDDVAITFTATATDAAGNTAQSDVVAAKDSVAPDVQVTSVTDPVTIANHHTIEASGTGEVDATITLVVTDGTNTTSEYTTTVGSDGTWSISNIDVGGLDDGTITFTATATDFAGNSAQSSLTATKVTVAFVALTNPINAETSSNVIVTGTGEVGANISLVASDDVNSTTEYTTTVGEDGTWSIEDIDVGDLTDGTITFMVTATDSENNTAQISTTATKDTVAPDVDISSITDPINADNAGSVTVSGSGEAGATITLVAGDGTNTTGQYATVVDQDGTWSIAGVDVSALGDGTVTFTVTAADAAGNESEAVDTASKDTVAPDVAITSVTDPIDVDNADDVTASGTGEMGASISLVVSDGTDSTTEYTTTVGEDGTWSITGIDVTELADGTLTFTATATDAAGNSAEDDLAASKDTSAEPLAVSQSDDSGPSTATAALDEALAGEDSWV